MRAFVTGASGFVGWHLVRELIERGARVRCLVRASSPRARLETLDVELAEGDLTDADSLQAAIDGMDTVFHCAADYRLYVPEPETMYAANVEGTRHIMQACKRAGVRRVVYCSTVGALGLTGDDRPADETTPVSLAKMVGHYKRSKFLAERVADEAAADGLPVVIVNPSAPVGDGDVKPTATGQMIVDFLEGRMSAYVDTGLNLIDVRDVAVGHVLAAERGRIGEKYILGHRDLTLKQILDLLAGISGLPSPRVRLPHWIPMAVAGLDTGMARLLGRTPRFALDAVRLSRYKMFFDAAKAVRELGLPQTPVEQPLERAVSWFREHGYIKRAAAA